MPDDAPAIDVEVVARLAGAQVRETDTPRHRGRSRVSRFRVDGPGGGSVVAKRFAEAHSYANEVASLRLLDGASVAPALRGSDDATLTFLMEDLGTPPNTADAFQHGTELDATMAFLATADALGRMHSSTFGREGEWLAMRGSRAGMPSRFHHGELLGIDDFTDALAKVGCPADEGALAEMRALEERLREPGPWLALTHGDPCPDNVLLVAGRAVVIDFEFASFRQALSDAVYPRMVFPTCWCASRVPANIVREFEDRYRAAIVDGCPPAADDGAWERSLADACAMRLVSSVGWLLPQTLDANWPWGIATARQRFVPRLQAFLDTPGVSREFPRLAAYCERAIACLQARWSDEENVLPVFPPFR
ncbi:MAG: phosphotransferase family protein [Tepidiformaceae bacterium]